MVLALVNEFDVVARADLAYVRSLVDLYRSFYKLPPVPDKETGDSSASLTLTDSGDSYVRKGIWKLPLVNFFHIGPLVVLKGEKVLPSRSEVKGSGATQPPALDKQEQDAPKTIYGRRNKILKLEAFDVTAEDFATLVFRRKFVHNRAIYIDGNGNGRWPA